MAPRPLASGLRVRLRLALVLPVLVATLAAGLVMVGYGAVRARQLVARSLQFPSPALREALRECSPSAGGTLHRGARLRVRIVADADRPPRADVEVTGGWMGGVDARASAHIDGCGPVVAELHRSPSLRPAALWVAGSAWLVALGLALPLVHIGYVTPLTARIARLSEASRHLGEATYPNAPSPCSSDPLDDLERNLGRAHERLAEQAGLLEDRTRTLEATIERLAHDLRTPLSVLRLRLGGSGDLDREELGRRLVRTIAYIEGLVENVLLDAQLRGAVPVPLDERFDLRPIVEGCVERTRTLGDAMGVEVHHAVPESPVVVRGSWVLATRAIANLLENAVVHNRREGHAAVVLSTRGLRFTLRVMDDGPGLPRAPSPHRLGRSIAAASLARLGWTREETSGPSGLTIEIGGPLQDVRDGRG